MNKYYIADMHIDHNRVIELDNRPFGNLEEMKEELKRRWNETVSKSDIVYNLGDLGFGKTADLMEYYKTLNGKQHLVKGNHDGSFSAKLINQFVTASEIKIVKDTAFGKTYYVVLSHYPLISYPKNHTEDVVHLYGHVHKTNEADLIKEFNRMNMEKGISKGLMFNVGCMIDYMDYRPRTLEEILIANGITGNSD